MVKVLSIVVTTLIGVRLIFSTLRAIENYNGYCLSIFHPSPEKINTFVEPLIIEFAMCLTVFIVSLLFTIKKQYKANFILFFCFALFLSFAHIG
jgi:hypothetical protein